MRFRHAFHAEKLAVIQNRPEFSDREMRKFWRELARLITFLDLRSFS
jgi:hypothetical protein